MKATVTLAPRLAESATVTHIDFNHVPTSEVRGDGGQLAHSGDAALPSHHRAVGQHASRLHNETLDLRNGYGVNS